MPCIRPCQERYSFSHTPFSNCVLQLFTTSSHRLLHYSPATEHTIIDFALALSLLMMSVFERFAHLSNFLWSYSFNRNLNLDTILQNFKTKSILKNDLFNNIKCMTCSHHNIKGFPLKVSTSQFVIHLIITCLPHNSSTARHRPQGQVVILAECSQAKHKFPNMTEVKRAQTK